MQKKKTLIIDVNQRFQFIFKFLTVNIVKN